MSDLSVTYNAMAADVFGPVEIDEYIYELQSIVEKAVSTFNLSAYQNAFSELRVIGEKPAYILDMPETGLELPRAADLEADDDSDDDETEDQPEQPEQPVTLTFGQRMAALREQKKAAQQ